MPRIQTLIDANDKEGLRGISQQYIINACYKIRFGMLSNLWLEAFTAMIKIDKSLARSLRTSSLFWSNPHKWLNEKGAMELVPTLKDLNERCEGILNELERRI